MAQSGSRVAGGRMSRLVSGRLPAPSLWLVWLWNGLVAGLEQEATKRRLFPWLAVAFGLGILVFFTGTTGAPILAAPIALAAVLAGASPFLGARPVALACVLVGIAGLLGFAAAAIRVAQVASPILARTTIAPLTGLIEALDEREEGARLIVRVESFGTLGPDLRPTRVRVSYKKAQALKPGDFIAATARLLPPPEAARPGGYDFARDAFFRGIGAVGSLVGRIEVRPAPNPLPVSVRLAAAIDDARNALTRRITDANGGQAGAVAAALVTGKRGLINAETNDVLRAAGIYHVVSISGLHMVLAAGVVFWLVRAGFALFPFAALHWPIKKIAALCAMVGVTAYCVFSGWDIAAERSLIMTLIMLGAILVDRPALSMRNLALAALIALAREPEGLLGPSFQMSFGAVAGLIACASYLGGRFTRDENPGRIGRAVSVMVAAVVGTLATTLVAQIATAPFATYHFQTVQPFGIVGNALTLPLVSLAVMPAAVLGILAYPFALDQPVWWLMGLAVRGMLTISTWIAGFGRATVVIPAFGPGALSLLAMALIILTLPVSRLRWIGLLPGLAGFALAAAPMRYDIYVDREGAGAAIRDRSGRLATLGRPPNFVLEQWLKADGDGRKAGDVTVAEGARCDRLGCAMTLGDGRKVALVTDKRALAEDCARANILVTRRDVPPGCAASLVIDRTFLAAHGATAIRFAPDGPVLATARRPGETVPWRTQPVVSAKPIAETVGDPAKPTEGVSAEPDPPSDEPLERPQ
ncbi:ComEC family competence protein [Methylobacterium sp. BTF04]|uniref:ComEC/Rec2 family competence protein n=1 Tax=Methylobacterium sp. BTF04 TaxID=2708300 RepID=UPI0013D25CF9|nr:ComEC/Rec2 family competence protein [Methylobacterium sp. BTF04]NEU11680.1 ComEC family competence protein [Methylobacterium sp. BTF04]